MDGGGCPCRYSVSLDPNGDDGSLVLHDVVGNTVMNQHECDVTFCCNCGSERFGGVHRTLLSHQLMRHFPDPEHAQ